MNKINVFGKQVPVFLLALAMIGGLGSAAVLTHYGQITTSVTAEQSVLLDGLSWPDSQISDEVYENAPGGETFCFKHMLENRASVSADVEFVSSGGGVGIDTTYWTIDTPKKTTIELTSKDESNNWDETEDMEGTLTYTTIGPTFDYSISASGLDGDREYALIYYADEDPRFDEWENENGMVIETFTTESDGTYDHDDASVDLNKHLPIANDWNLNPPASNDYCDNHNGYDDYDHCRGAKFWIVPTTNLDGAKLTDWNPDEYLFETDLGVYFDCDISELPSDYPLAKYGGEEVTGTTVDSGEEKAFFVCHAFDIAITPGDYTITTNVDPVSV